MGPGMGCERVYGSTWYTGIVKGRSTSMERRRKRWIVILVLLLIMCVICCVFPVFSYRTYGIENYSQADSSLSLSKNLFPSEDFLTRFSYYEGDYQYYFNGKLAGGYATSFSYLRYDSEEYEKAKDFCIQEFSVTDEHQFQIGDYVFIEHLCYTKENTEGEYVITCQYPKIFNMFAYNDSSCTLIFLGNYNSDVTSISRQQALTDFNSFYNEYFSQYYLLE